MDGSCGYVRCYGRLGVQGVADLMQLREPRGRAKENGISINDAVVQKPFFLKAAESKRPEGRREERLDGNSFKYT